MVSTTCEASASPTKPRQALSSRFTLWFLMEKTNARALSVRRMHRCQWPSAIRRGRCRPF